MCVLPPSDLGLMTPPRKETCSGCGCWVNYAGCCNSGHLDSKAKKVGGGVMDDDVRFIA